MSKTKCPICKRERKDVAILYDGNPTYDANGKWLFVQVGLGKKGTACGECGAEVLAIKDARARANWNYSPPASLNTARYRELAKEYAALKAAIAKAKQELQALNARRPRISLLARLRMALVGLRRKIA